VELTREQFEGPDFTRLKRIEELRADGRLDETLHWTGEGSN
jgi:hypothetical protein